MKRFQEIDPITIKEPAAQLFKKLGKEISNISFLGRGEASAKNWKQFFSKEATSLILEGISELTLKLVNEHNLCL